MKAANLTPNISEEPGVVSVTLVIIHTVQAKGLCLSAFSC